MAASAVVPTRVLAPVPNIIIDSTKTLAPALSPTSTQSLTAKTWIVPPRPRPGRKPAVDTPPTKRKAQNRAAQRAFRERRAAKVGELEEQMEEMERDHAAALESLRTEMVSLKETFDEHLKKAIGTYESDLRSTEVELSNWKVSYRDIEARLIEEQRRREAAEKELAVLTGQAVRLPLRPTELDESRSHDATEASDPQQAYSTPEEISIGCGRCSLGGQCRCVEEVFEVEQGTIAQPAQQGKRPPSPSATSGSSKRSKVNSKQDYSDALEIDFTTPRINFPRSSSPEPTSSGLEFTSAAAIPLADSCGFCQEGGPCACAQYAADKQFASRLPSPPLETKIKSPPIANSTNTVASTLANNCTKDPGNCSQCRSNPSSTLFCKSLASTRRATALHLPAPIPTIKTNLPAPAPCPAGAACCRVSNLLNQTPGSSTSTTQPLAGPSLSISYDNSSTRNQAAITGPTLSCADAFTALSRHHAFERASMNFNEWLPRLVTIPASATSLDARSSEEHHAASHDPPSSIQQQKEASFSNEISSSISAEAGNVEGRTAFEIEAASVMGVMRYFDRRFPAGMEEKEAD